MRSGGQGAWLLYLLIPIALSLYFLLPGPERPPAPPVPAAYHSDYIVFGGIDRDGKPLVLPIDLNRSGDGAGNVAYEYKGWIGDPDRFSMFLFERWEERGDPGPIPGRAGLKVVRRDDGGYSLHYDGKSHSNGRTLHLRCNTERTPVAFRRIEPRGTITTSLVRATVVDEGDTLRGFAVVEEIRFTGVHTTHGDTAGVDTTGGSPFGAFDWIALWSAEGDLWLLSQGEKTGSFAYHRSRNGRLEDVKEARVDWTRTRPDSLSGREIPDRWKVAVPTWGLEASIERQSAHVGHGEARRALPPPVYAQVFVLGTAERGGFRTSVYGMVEHIQDGGMRTR